MQGQTRANFQIRNFLIKTYVSCLVLSQHSKNNLCFFYVRKIEMPRIAFKNVTSSPVPTCFFGHCTAKNKNTALKFGMYVACM